MQVHFKSKYRNDPILNPDFKAQIAQNCVLFLVFNKSEKKIKVK